MRLIKQLLVALVIASLLEGWWSCDGCLDDERNALLQLKASFNNPLDRSLSSWGIDTDDCCKWENIHCNSTTGRVSQLTIWSYGWYVTDRYFNASLFLPFQELTSLSLPHGFIDCVENEGFERLESLNKLEFLDLDRSWFNNISILSSIGHLSSLKSLSLAYIGLESVTDIQGLSRLENLEFLDLSGNNFNDSIIPSLSVFPSLKSLNLAYNRLESVTDFQGLSELEKLEFLDLSCNKFNSGITPFCIDFSSLRSLYLWDNGLTGTIDIKRVSKLGNLEFLDLSHDNYGNSFLPSFGDLSYLKKFILSQCGLREAIDIQKLSNGTSLKFLNLAGNEIESLKSFQGGGDGGGEELQKLSNLEYLDLSYNRLDNNSLSSLRTLSSLKFLNMEYNLLEGLINMEELDALGNLEVLSLGGNQITKVVASGDMRVVRNLSALFLDNVTTHGRSSIQLELLGAYPFLKTLSLTHNSFKGAIFAQELGNLTSVEELFLDYSSLDEQSFKSLGALPSLNVLSMYALNATLPTEGLLNFKNLVYLDLSFFYSPQQLLERHWKDIIT
ncbi:receptor-like protein 9b [Hevea brasiliensis]|uniref:receptor-like protein 9b n=1 Tax=Hevea brasiliensis TaxID=3981 RepID=UPI0025D3EDFA|nr:receptor-like protein 9b [Hevea brasiliensis]XP_057987787.1 receptor-like protein 9b [Hevea brasiliensis]XP_057987788.1 receptor-like protein 9b [Hevea brasiliensis]